jgi:hypothetical protein
MSTRGKGSPLRYHIYTSSYQIPPSEVASDSRLDIESRIERRPRPVVRQLKREAVYYLRHNLVDLGHSKLFIRE